MSSLIPIEPALLFKKNDPEDLRLGNFTNGNEPSTIAILGYPDDEGIQLNGGRMGASQGPDAIRKIFYKMTPALAAQEKIAIRDIGNINSKLSLSQKHQQAQEQVIDLLKHSQKVITLGGGHDYGFPDSYAFHLHYQNQTHVVLNFDAHLDVRPVVDGRLHSGTPFYRLLTSLKSKNLKFFEVGIQSHCNSQSHLKWAEERSEAIIPCHLSRLDWDKLKEKLKPFQGSPLMVSFDIDCLKSSEAPGCSQSWPSGLCLNEVQQFFQFLQSHFQWKQLGIYEVAPPLENDQLTSKAAGLLMHQFIFNT